MLLQNKSDDVAKLKYPLEWYNKISIMRNIENMLGVTLGDPNEVRHVNHCCSLTLLLKM